MSDWWYTTPSYQIERSNRRGGQWWSRLWHFNQTYGLSETVILQGSTYSSRRVWNSAVLDQADKVYSGGRRHLVTDAEKTAIEASGVGGTFEVA